MDLPDVYNDNLVDEAGNKISKRYNSARFGLQSQDTGSELQLISTSNWNLRAYQRLSPVQRPHFEDVYVHSEFKKRKKAAQQAREKETKKANILIILSEL